LDKFKFYKGHRTSLDDLNELQDFFEGSDNARTRDWLGTGVAFGMELTPSSGTLMASISPGASYNEFGERIVLSLVGLWLMYLLIIKVTLRGKLRY